MLCNALLTKAFSVGTRSDGRRILASLVVTRYASDCQHHTRYTFAKTNEGKGTVGGTKMLNDDIFGFEF